MRHISVVFGWNVSILQRINVSSGAQTLELLKGSSVREHNMVVVIDRRDEFEAECDHDNCDWRYSYVYGTGVTVSYPEEFAYFDYLVQHAAEEDDE